MEQFAEYGHAIVAMAVFAMIGLVLGPLAAARSTAEGLAPGEMPEADYASATYRLARAAQNAMENMGFFVAVTVAAILAGASPAWVNTLAAVFLVSRIVLVLVHLGGVGRPNMGPRSIVYVVGWLCCLVLGVLAIGGVFA